jgi:hypothetical protein
MKKLHILSLGGLIIFSYIYTLLFSNFIISAYGISDLIFSKDSRPFGLSYSEWIGNWWQWHVSIPNISNTSNSNDFTSFIHPREYYSPDKCSWNQDKDSPVWFLPDGRNLAVFEISNPEYRECTITSDKAILVQIYGGGCSIGEGFKNDKELEDCVNLGLDKVNFIATLDGIEIMNSANRYDYLSEHTKYNLTYTQNNLYKVPAGTYNAMAGGYFLFLKPLSPGVHELKFKEVYFKPGLEGQPSNEHRISNVVYTLNIVK